MSDITEDDEGVKFVSIKMHKTEDYFQVPLINEAQEIIEKYEDNPDREVLGYVLLEFLIKS